MKRPTGAYVLLTLGGLNTTANRSGFEENDLVAIAANVFAQAMSFLGVIFLGLMLYGGFMWMTAMGDSGKVKTARTLIVAAVIGLVVITAAYAVTAFLGDNFTVK